MIVAQADAYLKFRAFGHDWGSVKIDHQQVAPPFDPMADLAHAIRVELDKSSLAPEVKVLVDGWIDSAAAQVESQIEAKLPKSWIVVDSHGFKVEFDLVKK